MRFDIFSLRVFPRRFPRIFYQHQKYEYVYKQTENIQ